MLQEIPVPLRALWAGKSVRQFAVFIAVGVLNTAFGYGCYALLLWLGVQYGWAALISTVLGVLFNFRTIGRFVFRNRDNGRLLRFVGVYAVVLGFGLLGLRLGEWAGVGPYATGAVLLVPQALLSYYLQSRWVFATKAADGPA